MKTTILIPCYNEVDSIPELCRRLASPVCRLGGNREVEILFVDDGSSDGTADAIHREAREYSYRIVSHKYNRGVGAAFKTGFEASSGEIIVTLDSDCTYDPDQIPRILGEFTSGVMLVSASPYHPLGRVMGVPVWRIILSKTLSRIYSVILPGNLHTYTSCFRAYRREVLPLLKANSDGFLAITELLASALLREIQVAEVPATLSARRFGESKMKTIRVIFSHMSFILRLLPLWFFRNLSLLKMGGFSLLGRLMSLPE